MEKLPLSELKRWCNDPVTLFIREHLIESLTELDSLSRSSLIEKNTYTDDLSSLEQIGMFALMRTSTIKGIELFTNFDELHANLEEAEKIKKDEDDD